VRRKERGVEEIMGGDGTKLEWRAGVVSDSTGGHGGHQKGDITLVAATTSNNNHHPVKPRFGTPVSSCVPS